MAWVFKKNKVCIECGVSFKPNSGTHKLCGNWRLKTGCSWKSRQKSTKRGELNFYIKHGLDRAEYKRSKNMIAKYNLSLKDYTKLLEEQNNVCAMCFESEPVKNKSLAVDHCHKTGKIRGLLCTNCNQGIGSLKEDEKILLSALEYLKKYGK